MEYTYTLTSTRSDGSQAELLTESSLEQAVRIQAQVAAVCPHNIYTIERNGETS